jgi:hypothetical protein
MLLPILIITSYYKHFKENERPIIMDLYIYTCTLNYNGIILNKSLRLQLASQGVAPGSQGCRFDFCQRLVAAFFAIAPVEV